MPAWLLRALDQFSHDDVVRDQIVFTLSSLTSSDSHWQEVFNQRSKERVQQFTQEQLEVLRQFLRLVREIDPSLIIQEHTSAALERLSSKLLMLLWPTLVLQGAALHNHYQQTFG